MSANRPFCVYCGNTRLQGHARDCLRRDASPGELERLQQRGKPGRPARPPRPARQPRPEVPPSPELTAALQSLLGTRP